jgi:predicted PurR-regulated permease PerM
MITSISGNDVVSLFVWLIVAGLIFFLLNWLIDYVKVPEPFNRVLKVVIAVVAVLVVINALLALTGNPLVRIG